MSERPEEGDPCPKCHSTTCEWRPLPDCEDTKIISQLKAADALAKAARDAANACARASNAVESRIIERLTCDAADAVWEALAAYENLRSGGICTLCGRRSDEHGGDPLGC